MELDTKWVAIGFTMLVTVLGIAKMFGWDSHRLKSLEDGQTKLFGQSKDHFEHTSDEDAHWTKREREQLTSDIGKIAAKCDEIIKFGLRKGGS